MDVKNHSIKKNSFQRRNKSRGDFNLIILYDAHYNKFVFVRPKTKRRRLVKKLCKSRKRIKRKLSRARRVILNEFSTLFPFFFLF